MGFTNCLCPGAVSVPLTEWWRTKGVLPLPHTRRVSRTGKSADSVMNGALSFCCSEGTVWLWDDKGTAFQEEEKRKETVQDWGFPACDTVFKHGSLEWRRSLGAGKPSGGFGTFTSACWDPSWGLAISPPQAATGQALTSQGGSCKLWEAQKAHKKLLLPPLFISYHLLGVLPLSAL